MKTETRQRFKKEIEEEKEFYRKKYWYTNEGIFYTLFIEKQRIYYKNGKLKHIIMKICNLDGEDNGDDTEIMITLRKDGSWQQKKTYNKIYFNEGYP